MVRDHWSVENNLHWVMDMVFRDDESRVRKDHAPANFATIKHAAFNFLKRAPGKSHARKTQARRMGGRLSLQRRPSMICSPDSPAPEALSP